ncbi:MAG: sensor histidine kinase [Desulfomonilaceae bacterium]|nr:sensor histidine kinase [Desulfomonilaceae bacterium]
MRLESISQEGGTIVVEDDGTGMTFDDIERAWMTIATPEKTRDRFSPKFNRTRTGAKGVGRFATRRLARRLKLRTVSAVDRIGNTELVEVDFDWESFSAGTSVDSVGCHYSRRPAASDEPLGTTLVLPDVRDAWSEKDVHEVQKNLNDLISPFPETTTTQRREGEAAGDPGFSIEVEAGEYPRYSGKMEDKFLRSAYVTLFGYLEKSGTARYELSFRDETDKASFTPLDTTFSAVGPAMFEIRLFMYGKHYFKGLDFTFTQARKIARERAGVRIFFDKFRVPGYGEPEDDWLLLDSDRAGRKTGVPSYLKDLSDDIDRPMLNLPGNNQLFGAVYLSREENPNLQVTLSREKLVETEAFTQLQQFVRAGINWMTVLHARKIARQRAAEEATRGTPVAPEDTLDNARQRVRAIREKLSKERLSGAKTAEGVVEEAESAEEELLEAVEQDLSYAKQGMKEEREAYIAELAMLRVLASTGTMIIQFQHQLSGILQDFQFAFRELRDFGEKVAREDLEAFSQRLMPISRGIEDIEAQADLFGLLYGRESRDHRQSYAVRPVVDSIETAFKAYMERREIRFSNEIPARLRTPPVFRCELVAVLLNFMTNALKAIQQRGPSTLEELGKKLPERAISVWGEFDNGFVIVRFSDTGKGADEEHWDRYFDPFEGDSQPDPILGQGTGLGLTIVKSLVESYGGNVAFVTPDPPWTTCVEMRLPED